MNVSESDILEALREAARRYDQGDGHTLLELAQRVGCSETLTRRAIRILLADGSWESVRVRRRAMDNRIAVVPGYRPIQKKRKR